MTPISYAIVDGNEATASVAYRLSEVVAIYPITPASPMGELADDWSAHQKTNIWGAVPQVTEMQSEGGAAGAVHGSLQAGALATTFTASQGLLLMLPNLYKIAGELTPCCLHVAARTIATHALSIFGDHSDVMACRQTGWALLASGSPQEAHDFACIAHAATLASRVPFMHFFDGFRTSHELNKVALLSDADLHHMVSERAIREHRHRALSPDHPVLRGTAQNPDAFFQAREASNLFYQNCPEMVQEAMDRFGDLTGRRYRLVEYVGHPEAERVLVLMGSGAEAAQEAVEHLVGEGEKVGVLKVRLYRPFAATALVQALPTSTRSVAVLDRTKEPGSVGEPLYLDVLTAVHEAVATGAAAFTQPPRVVGGRYGLSSKEFGPRHVKAALDNLTQSSPQNHFTVGIRDDVTHTSLPVEPDFTVPRGDVIEAVFLGLGSDGTVGANKNSIKIIGEEPGRFAQGYFVYDSKKAGAVTVSHLRFGPKPIRSTYLVEQAPFVACHQFHFLERLDVLKFAEPGGVFLLNAPYSAEQVWHHLPRIVQKQIVTKKLRMFVVDANAVAAEAGLGRRINTVMQTCFFAVSGVLQDQDPTVRLKQSIKKSYGKKSDELVARNFAAVDASLAHLQEVQVPSQVTSEWDRPVLIPPSAPDFVQRVTAMLLSGQGDALPVSAFPIDGTWPVGTSRWEKRAIATSIPVWDPEICIQCNKCAFVCPHAAVRTKAYPQDSLTDPPATFKSMAWKGKDLADHCYTVQVAPEDCTGCTLCVDVCPAKDKRNPRHKALAMEAQQPLRDSERTNLDYFLGLPEVDRSRVARDVKGSQLLEPLFEFSGACAGCGETPYIKLLTQLFGDRLLIANATGCSSIYGGNLPTTPYTVNAEGRGPAWSNSLFEDNAEFGLGFRLGLDVQAEHARELLARTDVTPELRASILEGQLRANADIVALREQVAQLKAHLEARGDPASARLYDVADSLVPKSVWLVGGDGWAYDIGYGGLDHVLAQSRNINVLVLDTEVYSNTGGQASKATPLGAAAKFAMAGKAVGKKDLGLEAMSYGHVYVARIAFGASDKQTVQALLEAEAHPGPSLVIAYSHCIAHGYDLAHGLSQQKLAVQSGAWPLYRFNPARGRQGTPPLKLDSHRPKVPLEAYMRNEARFRMAERLDPERFKRLTRAAQEETEQRFAVYEQLAGITVPVTASVAESQEEQG